MKCQINRFRLLQQQQKVKQTAFKHLIGENLSKEKTKHAVVDNFENNFENISRIFQELYLLLDQELSKSRNGLHGNATTTFV